MSDKTDIVAEVKELPRPPLRLRINDDKDVKMTYGLLMDLQRLLPDAPSAMAHIMTDPYTQDYVVRRVLTDSKGAVTKEDELIPVEDVDLTPEKIEEILSWVVQHILSFFAQRAGSLTLLGEQFKTALPNLFSAGSENSASTTPSAGPSEPPKTD